MKQISSIMGIAERLDHAFSSIGKVAQLRVQRYRVYRASMLELNRLSDRDLADLGLRRGMIRGLAKQAARRATGN